MTGGLVVDGQMALDRLRYGPGVFDDKWVRARVTFGDGGHLLVHDPRRFGSLELAPDESRLGPDALTATLAELGRAMAARTPRAEGAAPLKARLMDLSLIHIFGPTGKVQRAWHHVRADGHAAKVLEAIADS